MELLDEHRDPLLARRLLTAGDALAAMRSLPEGRGAMRIGEAAPADGHPGRIAMRTVVGAQLPRIC